MGRGDFFFGVLGIAVVWIGVTYLLTGQLSLLLNLGFKWKPGVIGVEPVPITLFSLVCDALLVWFMVRRLRDSGYSGALVLGFLILPFVGSLGGVFTLVGLVALVFLPGTIGPNRFGPDPRGWTSRAHYEEQQRRLKSGEL